MRYYYRSKDGKSYFSLLDPIDNPEWYDMISEEEFKTHLKTRHKFLKNA